MKVMEKQCNECLFSKNRIVTTTRMRSILAECARKDSHFICHKATQEGEDVCCRGFYDTQPPSQLMRIAGRLNMIRFVPLQASSSLNLEKGKKE